MIIKTIDFEYLDKFVELDVHYHLIEGEAETNLADDIEIKKIEVWNYDDTIFKWWFDEHLEWHRSLAYALERHIYDTESLVLELIELAYDE